MEIGDWHATRGLNEAYRAIRAMGLEPNLAELDAFGFTVIEGVASPELVERLKAAIYSEVKTKTGIAPDVVDGKATVRAFRHGINPLGCLPTVLQLPPASQD